MSRFQILFSTAAVLLVVSGCGTTPALAPQAPGDAPSAVARGDLLLASELAGTIPMPSPDAGLPGIANAPASTPDACIAWNALTRDLASGAGLPPPLFARAYALESVAVHDALELGERGSARGAPGVLVAAAGAEVLGDLFPSATARVAHELDAAVEGAAARGASTGAIASARALGRAAGRAAVRHAHRDGSNRLFTGASPTGECAWTGTNPLLPMAGTWSTWITTSGAEFQPEPPFPCGSAEDLAEVAEVVAVASARTAEQIAIVHKWADHSPPALWNDRMDAQILDANLDAKTAARLQAYVNMAMYDAFVSCWRTKYTYWAARPVMRSPGLSTVVPTPNFPSYTSGHATISAAAASVLAEAFPALADDFRAEAQEAAQSRLWGGIHFRHDNEQGLLVGARIGEKVALRMRAEAARAGEGDAALVAAVR